MKRKLTPEQFKEHERQIWTAGGVAASGNWMNMAAFWLTSLALCRLIARVTTGDDRRRQVELFHEYRNHLRSCVREMVAPLP